MVLAAGVRDILGNELGSQSDTFVADLVAPALVQVFPVRGTTNVALDAKLRFTFDEPLDASQPRSISMELTSDFGASHTDTTYALISPRVVEFTPTPGLMPGHLYSARVLVHDPQGNLSFSAETSFFTAPTLFSEPVAALPGTETSSMAGGDLDGDGVPDLVISRLPFAPEFLRGRGVRQFEAPVPLVAGLPQPNCQARQIVVVDFNGDGLKDVVAGSGCDLSVYLQGPVGSFTRALYDTSVNAQRSARIQVLDVDGDGKKDVIGIGDNDASFAFWRQNPDGQISAAITFRGNPRCISGFDAADLNGDGLVDLAFVCNGSGYSLVPSDPATQTATIVLQTTPGSFSVPQALPGLTRPGYSVTLADMDGDGRPDVVLNLDLETTLYHGVGNGTFANRQVLASGLLGGGLLMTADLNHDGRPDLVSSGPGARLQNPDGTFGTGLISPSVNYSGSNPFSLMDLDGDGYLDFLSPNGQVAYGRPAAASAGAVSNVAVKAVTGKVAPRATALKSNRDIVLKLHHNTVAIPYPTHARSD